MFLSSPRGSSSSGLKIALGCSGERSVVVEDLFFETVEVAVQFESGMACRECCDEDVGLVAGYYRLFLVLVHHLQDFVAAEAELLHLVRIVFRDVVQLLGSGTLLYLG